jgi:hypothetical protein
VRRSRFIDTRGVVGAKQSADIQTDTGSMELLCLSVRGADVYIVRLLTHSIDDHLRQIRPPGVIELLPVAV